VVEHFIVADLGALRSLGGGYLLVLVVWIPANVMFLGCVIGGGSECPRQMWLFEVVGVCRKSKGMTGQHKAIKE